MGHRLDAITKAYAQIYGRIRKGCRHQNHRNKLEVHTAIL
jgi:hypothetical protein